MADQPPQQPQPTPLGTVLGLGPKWQPTPSQWQWHSADTSDGERVYVLALHTAGGSMGAPFDADALRSFIDQALQLLTGLTMATPDQVPPFQRPVQ